MSKLSGKVAIVTGGASGNGPRHRDALPRRGREGDGRRLNEANGEETIAVAKAQGHADGIAFTRCDVAKEADVANLVAETVRRFRPARHRLSQCRRRRRLSGRSPRPAPRIGNYTFAVLVRSVFLGMKHASLAMRRLGDGGVILATASIAGMVGGAGPHAYSAAKAAVISLIENVAAELGPSHPRGRHRARRDLHRRSSIAASRSATRRSSGASPGPTAASPR